MFFFTYSVQLSSTTTFVFSLSNSAVPNFAALLFGTNSASLFENRGYNFDNFHDLRSYRSGRGR